MTGFNVPMENPPSVETTRIPERVDQVAKELGAHALLVVSTVGSAARLARQWVGVSVQEVYVAIWQLDPTLTEAKRFELSMQMEMTPAAWLSVQFAAGDQIAAAFMRAEREGWVTITDGIAYPTQKLADFLCR